jgi:oxygen-independent coproporphyrinogen-3 oxidase
MDDLQEAYFCAMEREMRLFAAQGGAHKPVDSVYIGGGTPSHVPAWRIARLLETAGALFSFEEGCEATIEANPGSASFEKLSAYRASGINRLSLGMQSASDRLLKAIGRAHTHADTQRAVDSALRAGFSNFSLDLMFALPGQRVEDACGSALFAAESGAAHVSSYALTVEEGHPFYGCCSEEEDRLMCHAIASLLASRGFSRYEISNYSLAGMHSRHNFYCWQSEPYKGFGAAAHSYVGKERLANPASISEYISRAQSGGAVCEVLERQESLEEEASDYRMLALRLAEGVSYEKYRERFGKDFLSEFHEQALWAQKEGLAVRGESSFSLTGLGFDLANYAIAKFL